MRKKINDVNNFNISYKHIKEMITYFRDKNCESKKKYKEYKTLTTKLKPFHIIFFLAATSSSITLSLTGVGLIVIPISTGVACGLTISNKVIDEIIKQKYS